MDASAKAAYKACRQDASDISYRLALLFEKLNKLKPEELHEMLGNLKVLVMIIDAELDERIEKIRGGIDASPGGGRRTVDQWQHPLGWRGQW